jgi:hypothetical protein
MSFVLARFCAPWGRPLRLTTAATVAVLLVVLLTGVLIGPRNLPLWRLAMVGLPLVVGLAPVPFMVRGYLLTATHIEVRRLGWNTVLPLAGLIAVSGEPEGFRGSVRLAGNGGLYAITGWFWNRRLGRFRAYATDPSRAVLLRYQDGKKVMVTPDDVQHFIVRVRTLAKVIDGPRSP